MDSNEWVAVIGCSIAMLTAIYSVMRMVTKSIMAELLPNSGKSMRDSIEVTKTEIKQLSNRVDDIYRILADRDTGR
jgi:hypothetical protein